MVREKIGVAMSGGVDSSVSAALLVEQGYAVHGFFMLLPVSGCKENLARVQGVAGRLAIPLATIDVREIFTGEVIEYFIRCYLAGRTPNPCMVCNRLVKFGALWEEMRKKGMEKIATGHYARLQRSQSGAILLCRGRDPAKDQSYFLARLPSPLLEHIIFPLGNMTKQEAYRHAQKLNLNRIHGPESQDICFLGEENIAGFFAARGIAAEPGDIVSSRGEYLGRHNGIFRYTVGQRRGLGLPDATPWYVRELDTGRNRVIVGKKTELMTAAVRLHQVEWQEKIPGELWRGTVQIRARHRPVPATVSPAEDDTWIIRFDQEQRAVTPGQFAVFYEDDLVKGSGIIGERI